MRKMAAILGLGASLTLVGCGTGAIEADDLEPSEVHYSASWANAFVSIEEMTENADLVANVTVTGIASTEKTEDGVYTIYSARVDSILHGSADPSDQILIKQLGGTVDGIEYLVDDDPPLIAGDSSVFFLTEYEEGRYFIMGGPTGRIHVDDGSTSTLPGSVLTDAPTALVELNESIEQVD